MYLGRQPAWSDQLNCHGPLRRGRQMGQSGNFNYSYEIFSQPVLLALLLCAWLFLGCVAPPEEESNNHGKVWETDVTQKTTDDGLHQEARIDSAIDELVAFPVPKPPFSKGIFPCSTCHSALPVNIIRRELTKEHKQIKLEHGPRERWCFDCHNQHDFNKLRLASGSTVRFSESYRLCGQCHGPKLRDWQVGVHGKRTGYWNGDKQYLLCANCHNPHSPKFRPLSPKPPPNLPGGIQHIGHNGH